MNTTPLDHPLRLRCGVVLKNRIAKAAMSDSLGDGRGNPTEAQMRLYEAWGRGGAALSIIGEVQSGPDYAEKPGNLVLDARADLLRFEELATRGKADGAGLWLQLGHAGALADAPISQPKGPSALDLPGLSCAEISRAEIDALPAEFARTAALAKRLGFGGVEIHAAHGFLLSQFLSPLFNRRSDEYGGSLANRMRLLQEVAEAVRKAVGPDFPVGMKINSSDQLEGGFSSAEALDVIGALEGRLIDLIDISGGTYFPGAASSSDRVGGGPYFLDFAGQARGRSDIPLMVTGGFKHLAEAEAAITSGKADLVGLARALVLAPELPRVWLAGQANDPVFPRFEHPPEGGVTAWFTMQITRISEGRDALEAADLDEAVSTYEARDEARRGLWKARFQGR